MDVCVCVCGRGVWGWVGGCGVLSVAHCLSAPSALTNLLCRPAASLLSVGVVQVEWVPAAVSHLSL